MNKVSEELAEVFLFYDDLYDKKLKLPDDMAIKVLLQELPDHIEHMFFCIRVENLNENTEMYKYSTTLRSITQGRGSFSTHFSNFELVPNNVQEELIKQEA